MLVPVILSGGSGTRLWPLSRAGYPKQFLPLTTDVSMLQDTVRRLDGIDGLGAPLVVCNEGHRFLVAEQLRQQDVAPTAIILEPVGRNTAPAVALAAMQLMLQTADDAETPAMLVLPADHVINDRDAFHAAVEVGMTQAADGKLVTFGIVPERAETGYGYIKRGANSPAGGNEVEAFVEKPDAARAAEYLASGDYLWNSGMFLFKADVFLKELERHAPAIVAACRRAMGEAQKDLDFLRVQEAAFSECPADSIDYAVMEKTDHAVVVPLAAGWSDVGDWSSLAATHSPDEANNVTVGDVLVKDSNDSYVHASSRLVAAVGLDNHVVVETADAVLVAPRERAQDVKALVDALKAGGRSEAMLHREIFRPWGSFDSIGNGERYQVKRLTVKPGAVLSLQMHHHRAEHWIVVKGTAEITRGEEVFLLTENQSTYIPLGTMHRIANPGQVELEIIEVQSGSYLGEDDIVRYEDTYGRAGRTD